MPTIAEQLSELVKQKKALANNLNTKGVEAEESEKLNTLVPKVLEIQGGGDGIDTSDATARNVDVRDGKTFYADGQKMTGNMPTISGTSITPSNQDQQVAGNGYLDGNITVSGDSNLLTQNIKQGISIFGVEGAYNVVDTSTEADKSATSNDIVTGKEAWVNGTKIVGDSNVMDTTEPGNTTASAANVQEGMSAYVNGTRIVGTCVSMAGEEFTPTVEDQVIIGPKILQGNKTMTIKGDSDLVASNIKEGVEIFGITGTYQGDGELDTSDATATPADMKAGVTAYVDGAKITGDAYTRNSMVDAINDGLIDGEHHFLKAGFYSAGIDFPAMETLLAANIKRGVTIYGITGTYGPVEEFPLDNSGATSAQDVYTACGESALIYIENDQIRTLNELQEYSVELKNEVNHWSNPDWGKSQDGIWGIAGYDAIYSEVWNISGRKIRYILKDKIKVNGETFTAQVIAAMAAYASTTEYRLSLVEAADVTELKEKIDSGTYNYTTTTTPPISDINQKQYETSWTIDPGEYYLIFETTYQSQVGFVLQKLGYFMI